MRIAQVAPLFESVPPATYGGTERVVSWLTEELVQMGHEVTLFASGDSHTSVRLVSTVPRALWRERSCLDAVPHHLHLLETVFRERSRFDLVHFHTDWLQFPILRRAWMPNVTTLHGRLELPELLPALAEYREMPLVSISEHQRRPIPEASWGATVHHGLPRELHTFRPETGSYLAFLGRMSPEKGVDRAIRIARATGIHLRIAGRIYDEERPYFDRVVRPLLVDAGERVEFVGEIGGRDKDEFLGRALALLFPIDWPEPFGLVMIEALACGTPVVAWANGSVPEVIDHGISGSVVTTEADAVRAVRSIGEIDRRSCRAAFERRFCATRMALDYLRVYESLVRGGS